LFGFVEFTKRFVRAAKRAERDPQVQVCDGVLRIEPNGGAEWFERLRWASHVVVGRAEALMRLRGSGIEADSLEVGVDGLVVLFLAGILFALRDVRFRRPQHGRRPLTLAWCQEWRSAGRQHEEQR